MSTVRVRCAKCARTVLRRVVDNPPPDTARTTPSVADVLADWRRQHAEHGEPVVTSEGP